MNTVQISHIAKSFGNTRAVDDVSFEVQRGEIFGLLGPNGAGKTTTLRVMLDIFKPDRGTVSILGGAMSEEKKACIGYMPEERGLYQDIVLERCLVYLATLKGLSTAEARQRVGAYLERFDLEAHKGKKVNSARACSKRPRSSPPSCTNRNWSSLTSRLPPWTRSTRAWSRT
jgi:ABC-2 type transport system ATP-binding protein